MKPVLADTSYFLALVNPQDPWHDRAFDLSQSLLGRYFVTEYVLVELGNALSKGTDRAVFVQTIQQVCTAANFVLIPAAEPLFQAGLDLFASRPDKNWSLVDCTSFVVMKQRRLRDALTADHHFEQTGFKALLK